MRSLHLLTLAALTIITTIFMCSNHYLPGLFMFFISFCHAFVGIVSCLVNILDIIKRHYCI